MVSLQDLFKYKKPVAIKDINGETVTTLWIRILGDHDLSESYKYGRISSSKTRKALHDNTSDEYYAEISIIEEAKDEELIELIKQSQQSDFYSQAQSSIDRENLPKMEEFANDPDAPTLEESEKRDMAELEDEVEYQTKISEYVKNKNEELLGTLNSLSRDELIKEAQKAMANLRALTSFIQEVLNQKVFRGTYLDKECKNRAFENYDDYLNQHTSIKSQLEAAYQELEINPEDIKN